MCPIGALGVYLAMKAGHNKDLREVNWKWDWTFITNIDTSPSWTIYLNTGKISGNDIYCFPDELDSAGDFVPRYWSEGAIVQVLLVAATQTIVTLAMLAAELLVNLQRDETVWRRAASQKGCRLASYNSTAEVIKSPFALFLFGAKAFIHWYFGQAIIPTYDAVNCWKTGWFATGKPYIRFELAQLIYLTVLMLVLTLVFTWLSFRRPYGPQPATYGHLQTLADLIDEWHPTLYWGDKTANAINYAGTSGHALPDIIMGEPYW